MGNDPQMALRFRLVKYYILPIYHMYIYIYRLKAGGSPELRGTLSLDAIPERSFLYTDGGGGGGCNNVMWSALDDVESWKMLLGWKMLLRCKFRCCLQKGGWGGVSLCGHEYEKGAFFIWSMVFQCIITCSTSEQNDQNKRNRTSNGWHVPHIFSHPWEM